MRPAALRDRLGSLAGRRDPLSWRGAPGRQAAAEARREAPVERQVPRGFERAETPYGTAWRLVDVLPTGRPSGPPPPVPHAYLDTETTGLAGGTGTQVFAASVCRPGPGGLELTQLFLADPSGEPAFLHLLQEELLAAEGVATYNGATFDLPLLRTRWVMARMPGELEHPAHTDLLTLTRSLYRQRLETCTLRVVEDRVLGFEREGDLGGWRVPEAYFAYLRRGWSPLLEAALEHNRQDVLTLYHLHARLGLRLEGRDPWMESEDWLALGRHLVRVGRRADGWRALRRAAEPGDGPASALAGLLLARGLARRGRVGAADRLLAAVAGHGAAESPQRVGLRDLAAEVLVAVARARLLEWRLREVAAARDLVGATLERLPAASSHRPDLERRLRRLEAKAARQAAGDRRADGSRRMGPPGRRGTREPRSRAPPSPSDTLTNP
jgi:uncharacterized protein